MQLDGVLQVAFKTWRTKKNEVLQFSHAADLRLYVTDNFTILSRITIELLQIKFIVTQADYLLSGAKKPIGQSVKEIAKIRSSELLLVDSIDVREILRFYVIHENLSTLLLQQ